MKVKDLIAKLQRFDPELKLVRSSSDHSFVPIHHVNVTKAEDVDGDLTEYWDDHNKSDPDSPVIDVVVFE